MNEDSDSKNFLLTAYLWYEFPSCVSDKGNRIEKDMQDMQDGGKEFLPHSALIPINILHILPYLVTLDKQKGVRSKEFALAVIIL